MDYIVYGWGIVFGTWIALMGIGLIVFYFLYKNTKVEDKHIST